MSNIDTFDEYAGRIFGELYESFPIPIDLNITDIMGISDLDRDASTESDNDDYIVSCTIQWLAGAGYLRMVGNNGYDYFQLGLTEKGLEVLKAKPSALAPSTSTLGKQIVDVLKSGTKDTLRTLVNQALSVGVKAAARSAGLDI